VAPAHRREIVWSKPGPPWSDVRAFCDALEIAQPIVYGASFGGMVALAYATRHPDHPAKLIVVTNREIVLWLTL
jgi:pimeloyl-ACP methyl ester carboxylesterase